VSHAQQNITAGLILPLTFALNVPRHPLNLLLRNNIDTGAVPEALQDLTTVEHMLIARVASVMSVMRLSEYRGGQW